LKKSCSQFGARIFGFWRGFGEGAGFKNPVTEPKRSQKPKRPLSLSILPNGCNIFENAKTPLDTSRRIERNGLMNLRFALLCPLVLLIAGCAHQQEPIRQAAAHTRPATSAVAANVAPPHDYITNTVPLNLELNSSRPTLFVAGDSTAAHTTGEPIQGWAVPFADYFDTNKVNIANCARAGRSSRTFISQGYWDQLLARVKPNDIVLIQFGHNDGGPVNDASRARGSLPGVGEETQEIDNLLTRKHETIHTFGWYLRKMVADVRAKGAHPILLSLTVRDIWKDGKVERGSGHFDQWTREVARETRMPFVDVTDLVADKYESMGQDAVMKLYPRDHTHFNPTGADIHAACVVAGLKGLRPSPVTHWLSAKGESVKPDRFAWLYLPRPMNPSLPTLFLIGDSTVRNGRGNGDGGQWGWGDYLDEHFNTDKINVVNRAVGGTSSRSFINEGYWDAVLALAKKGDFVMMQFGHNDNGSPTNPPPGRASLKGAGEETVEAKIPGTDKTETVHTYGWYLRKYISDARAHGMTPIVCSLIPRKFWKDGKVVRNKNTFAGWAEQVAHDTGAPFVDLNEIIASRYDALGEEKVNALFADPHTHTTEAGAKLNAECVVDGLKKLPDDPLAPFLK